jgi:thiol-disulfide isomerase/thioredoxin
MDRVLVLAAGAVLVGALVLAGRLLARRRFRRLRGLGPGALWSVLETVPDGRPAVVAFSTPRCAACHTAQRPVLAALEEQARGGVRILHVDAAERPQVASTFGVMTVPATVVLDAEGAVLAANQGFATAAILAGQVGLDRDHRRAGSK